MASLSTNRLQRVIQDATHTSLTEDEGDSVNAIEGMRLWGRLSPLSSSDAILDVVDAVRFGEPVST